MRSAAHGRTRAAGTLRGGVTGRRGPPAISLPIQDCKDSWDWRQKLVADARRFRGHTLQLGLKIVPHSSGRSDVGVSPDSERPAVNSSHP